MQSLIDKLEGLGFTLDPEAIEKSEDKVLADERLIIEASELWETKEHLIRMILQARINAMAKKALDGHAELLPTYQKAMAEVGAIALDFEGYRGEAGRLKAKQNKDNSVEADTIHSEPSGEGDESTL